MGAADRPGGSSAPQLGKAGEFTQRGKTTEDPQKGRPKNFQIDAPKAQCHHPPGGRHLRSGNLQIHEKEENGEPPGGGKGGKRSPVFPGPGAPPKKDFLPVADSGGGGTPPPPPRGGKGGKKRYHQKGDLLGYGGRGEEKKKRAGWRRWGTKEGVRGGFKQGKRQKGNDPSSPFKILPQTPAPPRPAPLFASFFPTLFPNPFPRWGMGDFGLWRKNHIAGAPPPKGDAPFPAKQSPFSRFGATEKRGPFLRKPLLLTNESYHCHGGFLAPRGRQPRDRPPPVTKAGKGGAGAHPFSGGLSPA